MILTILQVHRSSRKDNTAHCNTRYVLIVTQSSLNSGWFCCCCWYKAENTDNFLCVCMFCKGGLIWCTGSKFLWLLTVNVHEQRHVTHVARIQRIQETHFQTWQRHKQRVGTWEGRWAVSSKSFCLPNLAQWQPHLGFSYILSSFYDHRILFFFFFFSIDVYGGWGVMALFQKSFQTLQDAIFMTTDFKLKCKTKSFHDWPIFQLTGGNCTLEAVLPPFQMWLIWLRSMCSSCVILNVTEHLFLFTVVTFLFLLILPFSLW